MNSCTDLPATSSWQHKHDIDDGDSTERNRRDPNRHEYGLRGVSMLGGLQAKHYAVFLKGANNVACIHDDDT